MTTTWDRITGGLTGAVAIAIIGATSLACGGSQAPADTIVVKTEIHIVRGDDRERIGVRPEEHRIGAAATALERTLGHAVAIEVDAALLSPSKGGALAQAADSLEAMAKYFASESRRDPQIHAFVKAKLTRVAARYRASAEYPTHTFDPVTGALVSTMREPPSRGWFIASYELERAFDDAYARHLATRFAGGGPSVADADLDAYFRHLTTPSPDRSKDEHDDDRAARLAAVLALETKVRGKSIHADVETYLGEQTRWILAEETQGPSRAAVRAGFARWIDARFFATASRVRRSLYEQLFRDAKCENDPCGRLPELDRTRLALGFFQRQVPSDEKEFDAFDQALCLYEEKGNKLDRNRSCADVYGFLTENDARVEKLVAMLVATKRRDLLLAALINAERHLPALLAALDRKGGALYADALRGMIDLDSYRFRDQHYVLRAEVTRVWPRRVDVRPILLRMIVEDYARTGYRDEKFAKLPDEFGPIDAALFAQFLDEGPRAVELSPQLWPALRSVAVPFEIVAPRLDRFVQKRGMEASPTIAALVRRACQAKDLEGLRVIRVVLQKRAETGDKDALAMALAARDCKAP
jgi:hypothetical protein